MLGLCHFASDKHSYSHGSSCLALGMLFALESNFLPADRSQFNGIWCLLLLGRWSMFTGWYEMVMGKVKPNNEFVSADVRAFKDPSSYEMLSRERDQGKTPEPFVSQPITPLSPTQRSGRETPDYFGREARYKSPARSFSNPKPPQGGQTWDPRASQARNFAYPGMDPLSMNKI